MLLRDTAHFFSILDSKLHHIYNLSIIFFININSYLLLKFFYRKNINMQQELNFHN